MLVYMRRLGLLLTVMVLSAVQSGAVSAVFIRPDASGPIDSLLLSSDYTTRALQITGSVLAYELSWLFVVMAFPYLLLNGDLRFGFGS